MWTVVSFGCCGSTVGRANAVVRHDQRPPRVPTPFTNGRSEYRPAGRTDVRRVCLFPQGGPSARGGVVDQERPSGADVKSNDEVGLGAGFDLERCLNRLGFDLAGDRCGDHVPASRELKLKGAVPASDGLCHDSRTFGGTNLDISRDFQPSTYDSGPLETPEHHDGLSLD